ncbi:MAG: chemotaxis-specific protein-glutamate methyltransferase CheB [Actinobacteria bacterium]|nr:chemotaxis-specific protein-glutamate methyltransferase CheB [Actinomycetota bacterium]
MEKKIRVLIVEDSNVCAEIIKHILESDPEIQVVGIASNGEEAIRMVPELKPDIISMDIHMPKMNGLEATEYIMAYHPTPIIVVSSSIHDRDTHLAFEAISAGALDVLEKPDPIIWGEFAKIGNELINKVKFLSRVKVITHIRGKRKTRRTIDVKKQIVEDISKERFTDENKQKVFVYPGVVVIVASTGGPQALGKIISALPKNYPLPVIIGQHIAEGFIGGFVEWLSSVSKIPVKIVEHLEEIKPSQVYVCPVEKNTVVNEPGIFQLVDPRENDLYKPSLDLLVSTVAGVYKNRTVGVILTGMGSDGAKGIQRVYELKGHTIAQDETTSTVFGMPKTAIELGAIKEVLAVDDIGERLRQIGEAMSNIKL